MFWLFTSAHVCAFGGKAVYASGQECTFDNVCERYASGYVKYSIGYEFGM